MEEIVLSPMAFLFRSARGCIGCIVLIVGLILLIPAIGMFGIADWVYGNPVAAKSETLTTTPKIIQMNGVMTAANDYDIRVKVVADVVNDDILGAVNLQMLAIKSGADIADFPTSYSFTDSQINQSRSWSETWEFTAKFSNPANITLTFSILSQTNIASVKVTVEIYANPNRPLVQTLQKIGAVLLIPAILVIICGICIIGPQKRGQYGNRPGSGARPSSVHRGSTGFKPKINIGKAIRRR
jgi:hypothetical protein